MADRSDPIEFDVAETWKEMVREVGGKDEAGLLVAAVLTLAVAVEKATIIAESFMDERVGKPKRWRQRAAAKKGVVA